MDRPKQILRECLFEFDEAVAAGHPIHRVAVRLFGKGTACRRELELWVDSTNPLHKYSAALKILLEYCLCSPVERVIEAVHAMIKRIGRQSPNSYLPSIVAKLRESYNLEQLRTSRRFEDFVKLHWQSTRILDDLLSLRLERAELDLMSRQMKIKTIYQCTLKDEHEDVQPEIQKRAVALSLMDKPVAGPTLPLQCRLTVQYLKELFHAGFFYSMPTSLFSNIAEGGGVVMGAGEHPIEVVLAQAACDPPAFEC